jgi:hypothetical protein
VTPEEEVLLEVVTGLEGSGIPYMLTGSVASSHYGRPRTTHDADVVIDPTPEALARFVAQLAAAEFYVDGARAQDALRRRGMFNVIDMGTAYKIDLVVKKERPFSREEFARRQTRQVTTEIRASIATPEDTVLAKLEWARNSGETEKQLRDVAGVVEVRGHALDGAYIERWAKALGVLDLWEKVMRGRGASPPAGEQEP